MRKPILLFWLLASVAAEAAPIRHAGQPYEVTLAKVGGGGIEVRLGDPSKTSQLTAYRSTLLWKGSELPRP
ncbi:MAG TPA: hypothetical protein DEH78_00715, partial [Solibacterales bacterium]|nr:hypothetical protein [Bryobacterales bacterium]